MVAKITVPKSIQRALKYNEQKAKEGAAECIYAHNFLKDVENLNYYEKLHRFENLIALNKRAATNTIHISLNFGLTETIDRQKLIEIASVYMNKIGFGNQPYLVYRHLDAGHPHIHIVSTNIQQNGKRISLHNLGRNQSTTARKELEITYKLQRAEEHSKGRREETGPVNAQRITYGKSATKGGIITVLDKVLNSYKYASLAELNAVLGLYNVVADRGREDSVIYKQRGLTYRVLDERGKKIGVPIKASSIDTQPTLPYLEKRFRENELRKAAFRKNLKTSIDWIMVKPPKSLEALKLALAKEQISLVVRQNETGVVYGLTYIDHHTKCVFNGSHIGAAYSAKAILEKCGIVQMCSIENSMAKEVSTSTPTHLALATRGPHETNLSNMIDDIIAPSKELPYVPYELRKKRKRTRK